MLPIKQSLYNLLAPVLRVLLQNAITSKIISGTGVRLYYDRSQHLGFLFARQISYEKEFCSVIMEQVQAGALVFEIGSNIGQYALQIGEKLGHNGTLICVEPDSDNFAFLSLNKYKNNLTNIHLLKCAVSNKEGIRNFYKDTMTGGRMSSLIRDYSGSHYLGKSEEVETTTLDKLVQQYGIPSFVKIDVEGAEDLIFADESVIHKSTIYLIEVREETKKFIFDRFNSLGFSVYLLEQEMKRILKPDEIPGFGNLLIRH